MTNQETNNSNSVQAHPVNLLDLTPNEDYPITYVFSLEEVVAIIHGSLPIKPTHDGISIMRLQHALQLCAVNYAVHAQLYNLITASPSNYLPTHLFPGEFIFADGYIQETTIKQNKENYYYELDDIQMGITQKAPVWKPQTDIEELINNEIFVPIFEQLYETGDFAPVEWQHNEPYIREFIKDESKLNSDFVFNDRIQDTFINLYYQIFLYTPRELFDLVTSYYLQHNVSATDPFEPHPVPHATDPIRQHNTFYLLIALYGSHVQFLNESNPENLDQDSGREPRQLPANLSAINYIAWDYGAKSDAVTAYIHEIDQRIDTHEPLYDRDIKDLINRSPYVYNVLLQPVFASLNNMSFMAIVDRVHQDKNILRRLNNKKSRDQSIDFNNVYNEYIQRFIFENT